MGTLPLLQPCPGPNTPPYFQTSIAWVLVDLTPPEVTARGVCGAGKDEEGVAKYDARIMYAIPTPGLAEVEPSMNWNPSVVAGIGVVADPALLYQDMHSYLASSGDTCVLRPCCCSTPLLMEWNRPLLHVLRDHFCNCGAGTCCDAACDMHMLQMAWVCCSTHCCSSLDGIQG